MNYIINDFYKVHLGDELDSEFHKFLRLKIVKKDILFFDMWPQMHPNEKPQLVYKTRVSVHCPIETDPELYL